MNRDLVSPRDRGCGSGYPSGAIGVGMASLFGFAMGLLRLRTGGLVLSIVAHIAADATIYGILVYEAPKASV